jgi:sensor histidine kinase regulating citrate/malate metabolism
MVSAPLFDWVIENLLKNALDAMEGKGHIKVDIREEKSTVVIDVTDTGKVSQSKISQMCLSRVSRQKKEGGDLALVFHDASYLNTIKEPYL